ncbi:MAG: universal stress protein [Bacteroidales bacterium]|nr:universal stress protein [Bacteroidales bacterium]
MKKVLVLTDFTPTCFWSVTYGLDFCRYYGFSPEVLHVETPSSGCNEYKLERNKVEDIVKLYNKKFNLGASVVSREGTLDSVVTKEVEEGGFCLLVLCTHGKQGMQSLTGSAVEKIMHSIDIPMIVVQSKRFSPINYAILPVEVPEFDYLILERMSELANIMNTRVEFVCRQECQYFCDSHLPKFQQSQTTVMERSLNGPSYPRQVVAYCEQQNADMIFMISPASRQQQHINMMDQLIFNIPQMPVMCR